MPGATLTPAGLLVVHYAGQTYVVRPSWQEASAAGQVGGFSNEAAGRFWLKNGDGTMQEFRIE